MRVQMDKDKEDISIHAPVKGATLNFEQKGKGISYFNPRSREGSDQMHRLRFCHYRYFNPRSREGSDSKNHQDYPQ